MQRENKTDGSTQQTQVVWEKLVQKGDDDDGDLVPG